MSAVEVTRDGPAARVVLNRPDALNAWNEELGAELNAAIADLGADESVRAVLITGAGRGFSSGADLRETRTGGEDGMPDLAGRLKEIYHPIILGIREMPKPVIAAVNGPAVGIGCSLALACDLVIAAESSYFLLAFVNIGLIPDGGSSLLVPERIGFTRASEMALLGERIDALKAVEWGLANRAVPDAEFDAEIDALAQRLAAGPTRAYAAMKLQLNTWLFDRMAAQLELEARLQQQSAASPDFREGVLAFLQKRPPAFTGA
jgi:2-(1,2-epoxy-1,2-dihydrophenyl)acetyl-CoA isomerase